MRVKPERCATLMFDHQVYVGIRHVTSNTVEVEKIDAISGLVSDDVVQVSRSPQVPDAT
jgi:hypothetical protein